MSSATPLIDTLVAVAFLFVVVAGLALRGRRAREVLVVVHGVVYPGFESLQIGIGS